jgi:carboxyl-terminal processing protease
MSFLSRINVGALAVTLIAPPAAIAQAAPPFERSVELASFDTAWVRVRDSYYDKSLRGLDWNRLRDSLRPLVASGTSRADTRRAIGALLSSLGESHFGVIPGDAMALSAPTSSGLAGDAGIEVRFVDSLLVVTRVEEQTPAFRAGIRPGWMVEVIDTLRVLDAWRATQAVPSEGGRRFSLVRLTLTLNAILSGPADGTIRLVLRDAADVKRDLRVGLRETPGELVEFSALPPMHVRFDEHRIDDPNGCIGVIRFNMFMTPVMPRFQDAMRGMNDCSGIVLDLRGNLGGLGAMIVGMTGHFFAEPETLGTMRLRDATMRYVSNPVKVTRQGLPAAPYGGRVAIVIDELSASTTEIMAAAMQHLGRARVFGVPSAGQALPAVVMRLPNGDRLMYVIADFTGPGGSRVEGAGVVPDVPVPRVRSVLLTGRDDALDRAITWLRTAAPRAPLDH